MPALETLSRCQKAVVWDADEPDSYGRMGVGTAREITVRWVEHRRQGTDAQGNTISYDATVITNERIEVGSAMWLGKLADLPASPTDVFRVVAYDETPDIKARNTSRQVSLVRLRDGLPTT